MKNLAFGLWVGIARDVGARGYAGVSINTPELIIAFPAGDIEPAWRECTNDDVFGGPTLHGKAFCNGCRHQWVAVADVPATSEFECPSCHALKGVFERHVLYTRRGLKHWHCLSCEGLLFSLAIGSSMEPVLCCANCGSAADLIDAFPA